MFLVPSIEMKKMGWIEMKWQCWTYSYQYILLICASNDTISQKQDQERAVDNILMVYTCIKKDY